VPAGCWSSSRGRQAASPPPATTALSPSALLGLEINQANSSDFSNSSLSDSPEEDACELVACRHHTYDTWEDQVRGGGEVVLVVWSLIYLFGAAHEWTFLGRKMFLSTIWMCPSRWVRPTGVQ
jgi:hypothetical protein